MHDDDTWLKYPQHHKWFNKLWLAEQLNYVCGPSGVSVPKENEYFVKPIYNLSGMGVGARKVKLSPTQDLTIPGYFWCERFEGDHHSVDYEWTADSQIGGYWTPISSYQGTNFSDNLSKFSEWKKSEHLPKLPDKHIDLWKELGYGGVKKINIEWIDNNILEIHLRHGNIYQYNNLVPVWKSWPFGVQTHWEHIGYKFIEDFDDADGHLEDARLGFMVK